MTQSNKRKILINDSTLRDGNHAVSHQINPDQIAAYCLAADTAKVPIIEIGHGNGLGASSLQIGLSRASDRVILETARNSVKNSKLSVHVIPGFATIERDLKPAIEIGVDVFRVASHCTEANITERHISFCRDNGKSVFGVLMMSHMADKDVLLQEAQKMQNYGAEAVIIMDSAGNYLPNDVVEKIGLLAQNLNVPVGFHAHNNLAMGVANSLAAVESGAQLLDASARSFGAGAGNAQLEVLVAVLERLGFETGIDLYKILETADLAEAKLLKQLPTISSTSIVSGLAGVFSGFLSPVNRVASEFGVDPRDVFFELGRRQVVAGQEDVIIEVAKELKV